jgi:Raf kinase inhibitor-like YbhB/YbcL family protein
MAVASAAFPRGGEIPVRYTCEGGNVSPPLQWGKLPAGTTQMFLVALSLTAGAGGAIRWVVGGIDPSSGGFAAGQLPAGAVVGRNSEGHMGWAGACPAKGKKQSIIVLVYALHNKLNLAPGFQASSAQRQLAGNTLSNGVVFGSYQRP